MPLHNIPNLQPLRRLVPLRETQMFLEPRRLLNHVIRSWMYFRAVPDDGFEVFEIVLCYSFGVGEFLGHFDGDSYL